MDFSHLSNRELWHFATHASGNGRSDFAIMYLKQLLQNEPEEASALFLLGSEYAQIQMYEEALDFMEKAVALGPENHLARFQLGFLLYTLDQSAEARDNLAILAEDEANGELFYYAKALLALMADSVDEFKLYIGQGLSMPTIADMLQQNMQSLLADVIEGEPSQTQEQSDDHSESPTAGHGNLFLSVYDS